MTGDTTPTGLPVGEAAQRLGITPDAVRARIRRGSLAAVKDAGGEWIVYLPGDEHDTEQDADTNATASDMTATAAMVAQLQSEVEYLRDQLDRASRAAERERERADVLQREALQRIEALTPGPAATSEPPESPRTNETPAHGSTVATTDTTATGTQHDATGGILRWLRRLISG